MQAGVARGSVGEAGVLCPVCGKVISGRNKRQNLQYHLITHTNHKPFKCPYCPHRANRSDNMKIHIRTRHLGRGHGEGDDPEAAQQAMAAVAGQGGELEPEPLPGAPSDSAFPGGFGCDTGNFG